MSDTSNSEIGESTNYSYKDVSDDDFAKHQEHQDEDLGRKRMDDVRRGCKMCGLWMEDERCREVVRNV